MSIEIRELIITATVTGQPPISSGAEAASSASGQASDKDKEEIVQECVDQVMRILQQQQRR